VVADFMVERAGDDGDAGGRAAVAVVVGVTCFHPAVNIHTHEGLVIDPGLAQRTHERGWSGGIIRVHYSGVERETLGLGHGIAAGGQQARHCHENNILPVDHAHSLKTGSEFVNLYNYRAELLIPQKKASMARFA